MMDLIYNAKLKKPFCVNEACRRDGCSDRNAFCDSDSNQCKCKSGFHNNGRRCESISPKDTFNCKRFSFPCGMYDANFGENEQKICFCLKERRTKPVWSHCTHTEDGRPCTDLNAVCRGSSLLDSTCACKSGYYQSFKGFQEEKMKCLRPPKNAIFYKCGQIRGTQCEGVPGKLVFEMTDGRCFCLKQQRENERD
uniref:EGF-like domain-containing protein n=1 Tax=Romanomermis culicivorax TaxID=13658 RepID=A0A915JDJ2_ROMCU